ncbi:MAG TPA: thioredoxin domain-containing protein [Planctomycetota bacterium]|nr:thioredoxin domain-containing protein [Planctomycetota bacterium]
MSTLTPPVDARDHVLGRADATTLVEYGDYQCPTCADAHPLVQELLRAFGDRLRFVYRHFPLSELHPMALPAAEAAEAAGALGDFWSMHDELFENQDRLDPDVLRACADNVGIDALAFDDQLARHVHRGRVRDDFRSGVRSGVNGTPTFFIDGSRYDGPLDVMGMVRAIALVAGRT